MQPSDAPVDAIIHTLQERAKELSCLYRVHALINRPDASPDDVCRGVLDAIPPGWQYPDACWARITLEGVVYQPSRVQESSWVQRAEIIVQGQPAGSIEVFYTRPLPPADEGPFLKEERTLIDTIAERLAHWIMQRRLQAALRSWHGDANEAARPDRPSWWVIVEFLRNTDHQLLMRLSRRMVNYLCWNGVTEAQELLQRFATDLRGIDEQDENRPLIKTGLDAVLSVTDEAFRIAAARLSSEEILQCLERWIKDDKSGFVIEAVENQATSLTEIAAVLDRYAQLHLSDRELSRTRQVALRVALVRRFFTDDTEFINTAKQYVEVGDFHEVVRHVISPTGSHGKLGGKSAGLFLASQVLKRSTEYAHLIGDVVTPKTWYLTSDTLLNFIEFNHLEDVYDRKYLELDEIRREYPHIVQVFKNSDFPPEIRKGLSLALDDFEDRPVIVRSSSLLEDRYGAAFSGKYKSLFLANQGSKRERLVALMDAIAEVWASVFGPDPLEYRAERGLLDVHEEMGILLQEVVGTRVGPYFLPSFAGVAFSHNEFRWSARIKREDGLIRLVPGLGTRAVDRLSDDYPMLVSPGQPGLRANVTADEVARYSPRKLDVINLETREFETVGLADLVERTGQQLPALAHMVSLWEDDRLTVPIGLFPATKARRLVVTFQGLLEQTSFVARIRAILRLLREKLGYPVDIEFASDGRNLHLLQCRAQSFSADATPATIPNDLPADRVMFFADRHVANGRVPDLTHLVYVDPERYAGLETMEALRDVGRAVGRLNKLLPKRQFALMGPGRWGSRGDVRLGVSVTYSDISNTSLLVEVATRRGAYIPEVSFGTHFFQDLVESDIRYLPLFPGEGLGRLNTVFLRSAPSILPQILPEFAHLVDTLRVVDIPKVADDHVLRVLMNGEIEHAVGYLATPTAATPVVADRRRLPEGTAEDHWRWRLRMAERIAASVDPARFGVAALYVFGSTKNATAGPASDIDLLVHVRGTEAQRTELSTWLEGWSLCLSEMNFLRTGQRTDGLLDVHLITDEDFARSTSWASKVDAITDAARPLRLGRDLPSRP